jgi:hypothetical protein
MHFDRSAKIEGNASNAAEPSNKFQSLKNYGTVGNNDRCVIQPIGHAKQVDSSNKININIHKKEPEV